jgi:biotin operon repressor
LRKGKYRAIFYQDEDNKTIDEYETKKNKTFVSGEEIGEMLKKENTTRVE